MRIDVLAEATGLRIHLLGGFCVHDGEGIVVAPAWRLRKARTLVKLLALAPGHRLHREAVQDLLWPTLDSEAAGGNLRRVLHFARQALEPRGEAPGRYLELQDDMLVLGARTLLWIDVEAFEAAAAAAQGSGDLSAYAVAVGLYTGDLLPEDRYEDWA